MTEAGRMALALAQRGFHVLPIARDEKAPDTLLTGHGYRDATRDEAIIAEWFSVRPLDNVAVACGPDYGLLVLDVDVKNDAPGERTARRLFPADLYTLTCYTPSGGRHLYFRHPGVPLVATLPGIDVKGAKGGGYVLAPPSQLPGGAYRWRDPDAIPAAFPVELIEACTPHLRTPAELRAGTAPASGRYREGERHPRLCQLAAIYRAKDLAPGEIAALLWWHSRETFEPPFDPERVTDRQEVERVLRWVASLAAGTLLR